MAAGGRAAEPSNMCIGPADHLKSVEPATAVCSVQLDLMINGCEGDLRSIVLAGPLAGAESYSLS